MLVLSRRPDEKILLPTVPAVIKVISSNASIVRIGIEAPSHVAILREELATGNSEVLPVGKKTDPGEAKTQHAVRNRVNNLSLGMTLLRMRLGECNPLVSKTLEAIEEELEALRAVVSVTEKQPERALAETEPS